jgi:hypothetical protein
MRWTRRRFARDGIAGRIERSVSDIRHADERRFRGRQNRVVLTPTLASSSRMFYRPDRAVTKRYPLMTVAKEPGHRGERDISRKTIACGNAGRFRCTRCYSCAFYAHEAAGAAGTRHSPRPLFSGREINANLGRIARRGREVASGFAVIARSAATKQSILSCCFMDCFASLAMTLLAVLKIEVM